MCPGRVCPDGFFLLEAAHGVQKVLLAALACFFVVGRRSHDREGSDLGDKIISSTGLLPLLKAAAALGTTNDHINYQISLLTLFMVVLRQLSYSVSPSYLMCNISVPGVGVASLL